MKILKEYGYLRINNAVPRYSNIFNIINSLIFFLSDCPRVFSVVSGKRILETQHLRVQVPFKSMGFFQDIKVQSTSPQGGTLSYESPI